MKPNLIMYALNSLGFFFQITVRCFSRLVCLHGKIPHQCLENNRNADDNDDLVVKSEFENQRSMSRKSNGVHSRKYHPVDGVSPAEADMMMSSNFSGLRNHRREKKCPVCGQETQDTCFFDNQQLNNSCFHKKMETVSQTLERIEQRLGDGTIWACIPGEKATPANMTAWKYVSQILDRVFFYIYVILIAISLAVLFPKPPRDWLHKP